MKLQVHVRSEARNKQKKKANTAVDYNDDQTQLTLVLKQLPAPALRQWCRTGRGRHVQQESFRS